MKMLIGGAIATVLGVVSLAVWWKEFFNLLAGSVPLLLVLGGCFAVYLGFDEYKDSIKNKES